MAETIIGKIEPSALGGSDIYQITLDGMATSKQMDKLLELTKDLVKKLVGEGADSLKSMTAAAEGAAEGLDEAAAAAAAAAAAQEKYEESLSKATTTVSNIFSGRFGLVLEKSSLQLGLFAGAVSYVYHGLTEYSKSLTEGLKRGVGGSTFDLAIAAKSAGVSLTSFNKALAETGGGFVSLGGNATDGALQFGSLVKQVRSATASMGNLGFTNDELAMLTAQQTKVAISQGFKGRQAQNAVINNTTVLGKELENLAARTGKSTLELAQAAAKLSQDPFVASFVKTAAAGSKEVSAAVNAFAASLKGMFGERGEKIANDALKSAMSGLPMIITQSGKDLMLASQPLYNEVENLARKAARGGKVDEADREKLRQLAIKEVKERGDQLRQFALLGGPLGESANALLELAKEAEFYNSEEGKRQRRQSDAAKRFNTELNKLQASLQELLIPLLQGLNAIDWATIFKVVSYIPSKIAEVIDGFRSFVNNVFPAGLVDFMGSFADFLSKGISLGAGFIVTIGLITTAYVLYQKTLGAVRTLYSGLTIDLDTQRSKYNIVGKALDAFTAALNRATISAGGRGGPGIPGPGPGPGAPGSPGAPGGPAPEKPKPGEPKSGGKWGGRLLKGLGWGSVIGAGADMAADAVGRDTTAGKTIDVAGTMASWGAMGAVFGPKGAIAGALAGAVYSGFKNFFGDKPAGTASKEISEQSMTTADANDKKHREIAAQNQQLIRELQGVKEEAGYGNQINARGVAYAASSERKLSDLRFNQG